MNFIYFFIILPLTFGILLFLAGWINRKLPKLKPYISITASIISAYSASFVIDMIIRSINKELLFKNILFPVISWSVISLVLLIASKKLASKKIFISIGFYLFGGIAIFAMIIGHSYNLYVGLILVIIGFLTMTTKITDGTK